MLAAHAATRHSVEFQDVMAGMRSLRTEQYSCVQPPEPPSYDIKEHNDDSGELYICPSNP